MKKQEILDLLSLTELPAPGQPGKGKCAALVQRTTGVQDYVITKGGGIITDIGYKSAVVRILEYYPVVKTPEQTPAPAPEIPEKPVEMEKQKPTIVKKSVHVVSTKFNRKEAIEFLQTQNMNKSSLYRKSDKQLQELMDGFN